MLCWLRAPGSAAQGRPHECHNLQEEQPVETHDTGVQDSKRIHLSLDDMSTALTPVALGLVQHAAIFLLIEAKWATRSSMKDAPLHKPW